ncbi:MAG: hypothetical protein A2Z20_03030 [Bdellovibrionales bacterium RBG_16_40_8]|nr:MAG: hypothetical protein A2Z20_03030 [Bdellovibrionales bacterium RBG_16_40_8]
MSKFFLLSESDKKWCLENNVKITFPGQADYPVAFANLLDKPKVLFYIGNPVWMTHLLVSVVGSRSPQLSSLNWLEKVLGQTLEKYNIAVVSGGAFGIDQKSHQIAIRKERPTAVFLPSGLRNMYPMQIQEWVEPIILSGGCVISQFLPSQIMQKRYFGQRNLLIAALSSLTLVVECRRRSGTMLTAKFALGLDKKVCVMPTFPGEAGMGGLDLICDGFATPVRDLMDLELAFNHSSKLIESKCQKNHICCPSS